MHRHVIGVLLGLCAAGVSTSTGANAAAGTSIAAGAFALPPACADVKTAPDTRTPIAELRRRVEAADETDPAAAFALLCTTIPRVALRYGAHSSELAWWVAGLATPLIAYMDKFDESRSPIAFARPILERRYGRYGEPLGDIHVAYAWIYFRQGRLAAAADEWTEALRVRERFPGLHKIELQKVLVGLAQVRLSQREFASAERSLDRAHAILVENGDTVSEAGAAIESALLNVDFREERYTEARRHAEATLAIEHQLQGGAAQLVPAYALLGRVLERLDEFEQAETALQRAVELAEGSTGPLQRHHFAALYELAALLEDRGRPEEARELGLRAYAIGVASLGPAAPRLVPVLQVLADAEHRLGRLAESLHHFEEAGAIVQAHGGDIERPWLLDYYRDFGSLQASLGDDTAARAAYATGLAAAAGDGTLAIERARLLLDQAVVDRALGQPRRDALLEAVGLLRTKLPESHPAILRVRTELCELELATPQDAPDCGAITASFDRTPDLEPDLAARIAVTLSRVATAATDAAVARDYALRAVAAAENGGEPERLSASFWQLATVLRANHEMPLAVFFGKQALAQVQTEREQLSGAERRFDVGFVRDKVAMYREVADWLLELGRIDEGLAVLGLLKTEEQQDFGVRDLVAKDPGVPLTPWEQTVRERYVEAVAAGGDTAAELEALQRLEAAGKMSNAERRRLDELDVGKGARETERAARLDTLLRATDAAPHGAAPPPRASAAPELLKFARDFGVDTEFAVYLLAERHLRILMTARGVQQEVLIPLDETQLQKEIGHFLDDIGGRRDSTERSRWLYDLVARPVDAFAARHGVHRLVLWLDGALRYVPMAALGADGHVLGEKYVIQGYAPFAGQVPGTKPVRRRGEYVRGFGVTAALAGFPALPAVADELCYVIRGPITGLTRATAACPTPTAAQGALIGEGFADAAFTAQRFKESLAEPREFSVLHIGTHFRLRPGNALRSYLLLGDGAHLSLDELDGLDFGGIDVVTLSACDTGLGGAVGGDGREIEGLGALVQRRGAGQVIASLWPVDDASTAQFMRTLYHDFDASGGDAALGLQRAQQALRASRGAYADPYYWAGFIVYGSRGGAR